ncbi:hypothetical protein BXZ70DRAFT_1063356 [Cristinia sonorae]|uniref:Apolipoprotein N-acyltransferase n=1 Tax=Cristinia sonorae TaxID=1940300 RepID=A0A8K0UST3_9AGAR|nr:hypothetical protein BXZ70DRAFT_1063356 [Cristinia sonorae]
MGRDIRASIVAHPAKTFLIVCPIIAFLSLSSTPAFVPIVALVTSLRLWAWVSIPRTDHKASQLAQVLLVALASSAAQLAPTLEALSTPTTSLIVLTILSTTTSSIAFIPFFLSYYVRRVVNTPWAHLTVFPALWASTWGFMSQVSPLGHLASWSPVLGLGLYDWTREVFGQWGIDWITAAWAVVVSELLGDWLVAVDQQELDEQTQDLLVDVDINTLAGTNPTATDATERTRSRTPLSRSNGLWTLTVLLVALAGYSYVIPSLPIPPEAADTTPFTVGCALPATHTIGKYVRTPKLQDYIYETTTIQNQAPIVLWPEGAVRFDSPEEKLEAFKRIQEPMGKGRYVGISFEDNIPPYLEDGIYHPAVRRNGFALLGYRGPPVMEYYKRHLVPIAESFDLTPGTEQPPIYTFELKNPKSYTRPEWAPAPNYTRPIPVTTSICFDFASSSSFTQLDSRPAIILAPARTWHLNIGMSMWEQAKARAKETGSVVVWCDGGAGGVSGVAARGHEEILQVGQGTWTKTIGLPWPFDQRRTAFVAGGQGMALGVAWSIVGLGWAVEALARRGGILFAPVAGLLARLPRWGRPKPDEERPLLHD